jgi:hypothetical protein
VKFSTALPNEEAGKKNNSKRILNKGTRREGKSKVMVKNEDSYVETLKK